MALPCVCLLSVNTWTCAFRLKLASWANIVASNLRFNFYFDMRHVFACAHVRMQICAEPESGHASRKSFQRQKVKKHSALWLDSSQFPMPGSFTRLVLYAILNGIMGYETSHHSWWVMKVTALRGFDLEMRLLSEEAPLPIPNPSHASLPSDLSLSLSYSLFMKHLSRLQREAAPFPPLKVASCLGLYILYCFCLVLSPNPKAPSLNWGLLILIHYLEGTVSASIVYWQLLLLYIFFITVTSSCHLTF